MGTRKAQDIASPFKDAKMVPHVPGRKEGRSLRSKEGRGIPVQYCFHGNPPKDFFVDPDIGSPTSCSYVRYVVEGC